MKERPILFSGSMVRAILAGLKTQTRRVITPQPKVARDPCPYGVPGDRLWVRETVTFETSFNMEPYDPPFSDGRPIQWYDDDAYGRHWYQPHYCSTDPTPELSCDRDNCDRIEPHVHWTPSIHMPRWASRILLEITDVRVQRLQEISEEDARAEGADPVTWNVFTHRGAFNFLWDSINSKRAPWSSNPWVWAISFRRLDPARQEKRA